MSKQTSFLLAAAFIVTAIPAFADEHHGHDGDRHDHDGGFHSHVEIWQGHGDIHHFHEHDYDHWREGRWFNGPHGGRDGWWWIVGGLWYFYPTPVYPYPDPYIPPTVIVAPAPVESFSTPPSTVYYCRSPAGYYPYVARCFVPWQRVVSAPIAPQPVIVEQPQVAAPPVMESTDSERDADDRRLNNLVVEFDTIDTDDKRARTKLKNLEKQVETFRQTLYSRSYNAIDIIKDADALEHRIAAERETLR